MKFFLTFIKKYPSTAMISLLVITVLAFFSKDLKILKQLTLEIVTVDAQNICHII